MSPASTAAAAENHSQRLERLKTEIDSVYFLISDGWPNELESNRWHYARRWARHLPVTLLQPSQRLPRQQGAASAAAIHNCEVLPVTQTGGGATQLLRGLVQTNQVMDHMAERGHSRPLLWCYNPSLAPLYAAIPAISRVFHASENYFDYAGLPSHFRLDFETALRISDLVIPVSSGVADAVRRRVPEARVEMVTNGCDGGHYQLTGPTSAQISAAREKFERVAVFAGNVNSRVDFDLVERVAASNGSTAIFFVGPADSLDGDDAESWRKLCSRQNIQHLGRMTPEQLAAVYRSCDLGFIPYRHEERIVRNGFPLKTLEMAATGLPVVASHMKPIVGLASAIAVAEDDDQFLASFASLSRSALSDEERVELLEVAAANDYDRKFEQVVRHVADSIPAGRSVQTRLDDLVADLGTASWHAGCRRLSGLARAALLGRGAALLAYDGLTSLIPAATRHRLISSGLRRWARSRVE